jgi:tetratricopeptide (TPR) repeat protein
VHQQLPVHRAIMVVDVEHFCDRSRTNLNQLAIREGLYKALAQAFRKSGIVWANCVSEDCGDGVLILIPPDVSKTRLVTSLPAGLAAAVARHNAGCAEPERMRLRVALHAGEVYHDAHGVAGASINHAFRLAEAPALKSALDASPGVLALIVSDWLYDEVVRHDPAAVPGSYRPVRVTVKETAAAGWIRLPDLDIVQAAASEDNNPPQDRAAASRVNRWRAPRGPANGRDANFLDSSHSVANGSAGSERGLRPAPAQLRGFTGHELELAALDSFAQGEGPVVQGRGIYDDASITVGPPRLHRPLLSQMPLVPANFTGRSAEMAVLDGLAVEPDSTRHLAIVVIVGSGGLGKTSLASYWLHRVSDRYPDGILFADLGGQSLAGAAPPENVLTGFLRALGVAPESIPSSVDQQAALFRSVTAGRKMAVFLDNAASAAQVRVLLPGPGPAPEAAPRPVRPPAGERVRPSLVLVTTRWRITGLAMDGARFLELGSLAEPEARELFGHMIGADRVTAEADASGEVVRLCGGIPLAVCVSGARLAAHPRWPVSRIVRELTAERGRLSALSLAGDLSVRAAFDASYQALPADVARAYRMVALIPGPDFCAGLAAAVLDDQEHAQGLLDALADASLLTESPDGRYHLHDLARLHAREQAGSGSPTERRSAIARSVTWYLREAVAADLVVLPGRWRLGPLYERASSAAAAYGSPAEALEWLESHLPGLLAAVQAAHGARLHAQAWQLCEALWGVLLLRRHYAAWLASHEAGLRSARACADDCAEAQMHIQLGAAHRSLGRLGSAVRHFTRALELFRAAGHRLGEASALGQLGVIQLRRARYDKAIGRFTKAREIHQDIGRPRGIALMNLNIGQALAASGRQVEAAGYLRVAEEQFAAIGESYHRARALDALGGALIEIGQAGEAAEPLGRALAITEELGASYDRAHIHVRLAALAETLGQTKRARGHLEQALGLFTGLDAPQAESVRTRLAQSGGSPGPGPVAAEHRGPPR